LGRRDPGRLSKATGEERLVLRKKLWVGVAAAAALIMVGVVARGPLMSAQAEGQVKSSLAVAYFEGASVYDGSYFVRNLPAGTVNVVKYASGVPTYDEGTGAVGCEVGDPWADYQMVNSAAANTVDGVADNADDLDQHLFGNFNQLRKLKKKHPNLKVQISLGGWAKSTWFATVAATPERRQAVVKACIDTFIKGDLPLGGWPAGAGGPGAAAGVFDGIELDWQYPTQEAGANVHFGPADRRNATLLLQEFRKQLDEIGAANGKRYLLTAALPADKNSGTYFELAQVGQIVDGVTVVPPSVVGPSGKVVRAAPGANAKGPHHLGSAVRPDKIVLDVSFYPPSGAK
jgi:chitinase